MQILIKNRWPTSDHRSKITDQLLFTDQKLLINCRSLSANFYFNNIVDEINNFLREYLFIENYLVKRKKNEIIIQLKLKQPFAINNLVNEVIFIDNTTAPTNYFETSYLESINLIDISQKSIYINNYLNEYYQSLSNSFEIDQIEYIEDRRYNLVLNNGKIVMLPKVIDSKLLYFIKNNIDLINKSTNYSKFLDLRNFHNKTIRLK